MFTVKLTPEQLAGVRLALAIAKSHCEREAALSQEFADKPTPGCGEPSSWAARADFMRSEVAQIAALSVTFDPANLTYREPARRLRKGS